MVEVKIFEMTATDGRNFTCVHFITEIFSTQLCQNWPYQSYLSSATNTSDGLSPKRMRLKV